MIDEPDNRHSVRALQVILNLQVRVQELEDKLQSLGAIA